MELIPDKILRDGLGVKKDTPVYYLGESVVNNSFDKLIKSNDDYHNVSKNADDYISKRPFDECVIIFSSKKDSFYLITHFENNETYRSFSYSSKEGINHKLLNNTVRENFNFSKINIEEDARMVRLNQNAMISAIAPFCIKKNIVSLSESKTIKHGKKGKSKKQKFLYVTSNTYEPSNQEFKNIKTHESFNITKVAGHMRTYHKNPETKGHDRHGNNVVGWTWVRPYTKGEGLEIQNKIRLFLK